MKENKELQAEFIKMKLKFEEVNKEFMALMERTFLESKQTAELYAKDGDNESKQVTYYLMQIGIPANLLGFKYIRDAILLILHDGKTERLYVTKDIYPAVAKLYRTNSSRIERAIRHAITCVDPRVWDKEPWNAVLGYSSKWHPSNSEFLAVVAEEILLKMK